MLIWILRGIYIALTVGIALFAIQVLPEDTAIPTIVVTFLGVIAVGGLVIASDLLVRDKQMTTFSALFLGLLLGLVLGWLLSSAVEPFFREWLGRPPAGRRGPVTAIPLLLNVACCDGTSSTLVQAKDILAKHRIEKLTVVNESGELKGLITVKDIEKRIRHPHACKDTLGRLRVAAAVGAAGDFLERAQELVRVGVDAVVVDSAHGHSIGVVDATKALRAALPDTQIVAGNVGTGEGARALADAGADAVKVGMGPGAICTTRVVSGAGMAQVTAILEAAKALEGTDVPVIADGGIKYSGDIAKAIAAGGHSVMLGGLFAGCEESPGETVLLEGRQYKVYRGMGSLGAMAAAKGSRERYFQEATDELAKLVPEGIEGRVPFKGPLAATVFQLVGGLRAGMGYCGVRTIDEMRTHSRFSRISGAGLRESHPHDIKITKEAPNYEVR